SIPDAAGRSVVITPTSLHFGVDDVTQRLWTTTSTLLLQNQGSTVETFSLSALYSSMPGVTLRLSPSTVIVSARSASTVTVTLAVDNSRLAYKDSMPSLQVQPNYFGSIIAQFAASRINIPFG